MISMSRAWDKEKTSESPTGFEPMTFQTPGGRSSHSSMSYLSLPELMEKNWLPLRDRNQ